MKNKYNLSNDDNYRTPPEFYQELNMEFNFDFDPCPYTEDAITPETDGLLKEWGKSNYVNPPYSKGNKNAFVMKAIHEKGLGKKIVMLLPVVTSSSLFHDYIKPNAKEIRFIKGRIKFQKRDNKGNWFTPKNGSRHDSMIVIF